MNGNPATNENPGCIGRLFALLGIKPGSSGEELPAACLPYRQRDDFLSRAEHSFFLVLRQMMGQYFTVLTKVNLSDIFYVSNPHKNQAARNKIDRKHVDFLICDPKTMEPRFAIELDDASHIHRSRQERDRFVDEVFETAGLPLVRVIASASYSQAELGALFKAALSRMLQEQASVAEEEGGGEVASPVPLCPKCGEPMVLREAKRGKRRGERFFGCLNYPRCREVIQTKNSVLVGESD